ncbi:MAG: pyridoxamine 5'-phosphate oxidase family protein [Gammaproteobacteria bacterium]|nr:pyridoxamine 5'-phosphate oxidase family protein [Gammaproteobacteria bacterium]
MQDTARPATPDPHLVTSEAELTALYGDASPIAITKEIDHISAEYRAFVDKAPFVILASVGPEGLDCTPRGDPAGFVRVVDPRTVLIPDRRGNNRIDTLRNIVRDPRIALLFLIPGVGETLRINGRAEITTDPALCASFEMQGKAPRTVLRVHVERVYFQCPKALIRSRLWSADAQIARSELPTAGQIVQAITANAVDGKAYDDAYPERVRQTIY